MTFKRLIFSALGALGLIALLVSSGSVRALIGGQTSGSPASGSSYPIHQPAALNNGLIAWYTMDGDVLDKSGNTNNGTLTNFNGDATDGYAAGKFGKGILLDGTNDYVSIPGASFPAMGDNLTLSAWINPTALSGSETIFGQGNSGTTFAARLNSDGSLLAFYFGNSQLQSTAGIVKANTWSHVLYTKSDNGSGTCAQAWYINGVAAGTSTSCGVSPYGDSAGTKYIGSRDGTQQYFPGTIDDFRLYNRALTSAEAAKIYAGSKSPNCDQTCIGWWKLDESGSTTTAVDSVNGNNGTLSNFTFNCTTNCWSSGVFGNGLLFNGSNTAVDVGNPAVLDVASSSFTWSLWFRTTAVIGATSSYPITVRNAFAGRGFDFAMVNPSGMQARVSDGTSESDSTASGAVNDGSWHYAVGVVDRTNNLLNFYMDGRRISSGSISGFGSFSPSTTVRFGERQSGNGPFNGTIDDVKIWNRALSGSEVNDQYLAGR